MEKSKVVRVDSPDGEIHYVLQESLKDSEMVEIKRISRKEAAKPLILFREE